MEEANDNDKISKQQVPEQPDGWFDPETFRENLGNQNPHAGNPNFNDRLDSIQQSQVRAQFKDRAEFEDQFGNSKNQENNNPKEEHSMVIPDNSPTKDYSKEVNGTEKNIAQPTGKVPYGDRFDEHQGRTNSAADSNEELRNKE